MGLFRHRPKAPPRTWDDPVLGHFVADGTIWEGSICVRGETVPLYVAGDVAGPDPVLLRGMCQRRDVTEHLVESARDLVVFKFRDSTPSSVELYAIEALWPDNPTVWTVELYCSSDPDGIHRVTFDDERIVDCGRDD